MKRLKSKKGFTMAELLIVVAIIAVLVAISVPIFSTQLKRSRASTDAANIRSGYAAATSYVLTNNITANTVFYLKNDGSVRLSTDTTDTSKDYICKGDADDLADANTTIGSQLAKGTGAIDWDSSKKYIKYTYTESTGSVTISAETTNTGSGS